MPASGDLEYGLDQLAEETSHYDEATVFYEGRPQEVFSSAEVKRLLRKSNLHELKNLNFAKIPVDEVVSRLRVLGASVTNDKGEPHQEAQAALDQIMVENRLDTELNRLWQDVSQLKNAYLFVWPRLDEEDAIIGVDVLVQNPRTCTVVYNEERQLDADYQVKMWCSDRTKGKEIHSARVYYPDGRIEYYETKPGKACNAKRSWQHTDTLESDFGLPLYHFSIPWPEHYWAYTAQLIINKLVITQVATVERLGFPQRYGLIDPKVDDTREREFNPDDDGDDDDDRQPPKLRNEPGAFHELEYRAVGEFDAANPASFLSPLDWFIRAISQLTSTPMHLIDPQLRGQVSGESLKVSKEPLTNKVLDRHQRYTGTLKDALEHALWLLGFDDAHVSILWEPAEPMVDEEDPADLEIKRATAVVGSLNDLASATAVGAISPQNAQELVEQLLLLIHGESGRTEKGTAA